MNELVRTKRPPVLTDAGHWTSSRIGSFHSLTHPRCYLCDSIKLTLCLLFVSPGTPRSSSEAPSLSSLPPQTWPPFKTTPRSSMSSPKDVNRISRQSSSSRPFRNPRIPPILLGQSSRSLPANLPLHGSPSCTTLHQRPRNPGERPRRQPIPLRLSIPQAPSAMSLVRLCIAVACKMLPRFKIGTTTNLP